ncbi:uncharacterized protein [Elaeis guineensis]|uniref:Uncharacterized protein LOC105056716 n=1 Tax=Elaeis guineensis var. tenera TaxID=51953 RepID=A0A6I9S3Z5_ELAGV|nr:uncharacterized protein LOC105056716 [Elaeis guineensis]
MSATVMSGEAAAGEEKMEVVEAAACECCGLTEECTPGYIARVRERYAGRWVCGLCGEAVEDEIGRSGRRITTEEAMTRQVSFCRNFRAAAASPVDPAEHFIAAVRHLLRRSLDSPRVGRSTPDSPLRKGGAVIAATTASARSPLVRTESCFSTLAS